MIKEIETCPHCGHENVITFDPRLPKYIRLCENCRKAIHLCSVCNETMKCDWHLKLFHDYEFGICMHGVTINKRTGDLK